MFGKKNTPIILIFLGLMSLLFYNLLFYKQNLFSFDFPSFVLTYFILFLIYIFSIFILKRHNQQPTKTIIVIIIIFSVLFRITLLPKSPLLSNDIYRYKWDGKIMHHGLNPYNFYPSDPRLTELRKNDYKKIGHSDTYTTYPPLSQFFFKLAYRIDNSIYPFKIIFTLFDFGTIILLILILKYLAKNILDVVIYAWNPLVIVEIAKEGHLDSLAIFWLFLALFLYIKKRKWVSSASMVFSLLSKLFALPLFIFWLKVISLKKKIFTLSLLGLLFLPFLDAKFNLIKGITRYLRIWEFNGSLFPLFLQITNSYAISKAISFLILGFAFFFIILKKINIFKSCFILIGIMLIISPTVYPWYLLWIIPFLCIYPRISWLILSATIILSYTVLIDYFYLEIWQENQLTKLYVYLPFYVVLFYEEIKLFSQQKRRRKIFFKK